MESFTANFLANLAAELSAVLLPALGRRVQAALLGDEAMQALQRSLHAGLVALLAEASAASPDHEALLADIFHDFLQQSDVATEIARLLRGQTWDLDELGLLFAEAGYEADTLPGLDFTQGMEAFAAAFLTAIAAEPALQNTLQTHQLLAQTRLQQALLAQMEQLVKWLQQAGPVRIQAGSIVAERATGAAPSIFLWPGRAADDDSARTAYLKWMMTERQNLPLRAVSSGKIGGPERPPELAKVYVALNTTARIGKKGAESGRMEEDEKSKPLSALAALATRRRMVLLGDPGSGKSTFVSHLAYCLAAHALYPAGGWLGQLAEWPAYAAGYLPVLIVLRDFARWLPQPLPAKAHAHYLWDFIAAAAHKEKLEGALPLLEQALTDGQALLLLDGLDEVTTPAQRRFVRDAVHAFSQRYAGCYLLVTCRPFSYLPPDKERGEEELRLPAAAYPTFSLAPFDETQQDAFVRAWYQELKRQGHLPGQDEARLSQDLQRAIRRSDLRRVAGNPLLLTVMAMVHVEGRLPDSRALLYNKTIDLLLSRWEETKSEDATPLLRQLLQQANRTDGDLKARLAAVAFDVHTQGGSEADNEQVADIGETVLCQELSRLHQKDLGWGQQLLGVIKTRAGLLIERSPGQFAFPHRTFQEYLAGVHLASQPDFPKRALTWAQQGPGWWPMALFAVEHLVNVSQRLLDPLPLIGALCPETADESTLGWQLTWLAGDALLGLGQARAEDNEWGRQLWQRVRQRLADLLDGGYLAVTERAAAGRTLAQLGDPRPGVGWVERDGRRIPDIVWGGEVPAGRYTIGDDKSRYDDEKSRVITINHPYRLSRYPVTYAQFQCFLDAPDFDNDRWWAGMPAMVKPSYSDAYPLRELSEQAFPFANHPRESVSWYQAVAFCRWLSAQVGYTVELPHEHEWEVAARRPNNQFYPWGNDFAADKANTNESSLNSTTAVGMYPTGRNAALALYDLSGNVWEWCRNKYDRPDDDQIDGSEARRVLRGGAWTRNSRPARAADRYHFAPASRAHDVGFRLVCVRRPPSR